MKDRVRIGILVLEQSLVPIVIDVPTYKCSPTYNDNIANQVSVNPLFGPFFFVKIFVWSLDL